MNPPEHTSIQRYGESFVLDRLQKPTQPPTVYGFQRSFIGPLMHEPEMATVYRLFDADDVLLYVGATIRPGTRLGAHHRKPWWRYVARAELRHYTTQRAAYQEETNAIATEHPVFNVRGRLTTQ